MKNRRIAILAFLLAAVLCLGVGYALAPDDLAINGTVSVDAEAVAEDFAKNVYFADADNGSVTGVTATIGNPTSDSSEANANDVLTIAVDDTVLTAQGDTAVVTVKVKNDNKGNKAQIATVVTGDTENRFTVTVTNDATDNTIDAEGFATLTVTIKLESLPTDGFANAAFSVAITATAVANS